MDWLSNLTSTYNPELELTPEQKSAALNRMLLTAGGNIYQASQGGQPGTGRANLGSALVSGMQSGAQELGQYGQEVEAQRKAALAKKLTGLDMKQKQLAMDVINRQQSAEQNYLNQVPESLRAQAAVDPAGFIKQQNDMQMKLLEGKVNKDSFNQEAKLRGELIGQSKDFVTVKDSYGRLQAAATNPSAAGDMALIFNYMKILDPGSTVREGEFATAQNSAGVDDRTRAMFNKILKGERLAENQRADFVNKAYQLYDSQKKSYDSMAGQYTNLAGKLGLDPTNVVLKPLELGNQVQGKRLVYDPTTGGFK